MKIILLLLMFTSYSAVGEEYKSLSCSKKETGTQIVYINGVMNTEDDVIFSAERIREIFSTDIQKKKIDANKNFFVDYVYNNSEEFGLDFIQTAFQKIQETGQLPQPKLIGAFIFKSASTCLSNPVACAGITLGVASLLAKQIYISSVDIKQMTDFVKFHLDHNYKVIVVSHSQGNLYANYVYSTLLSRGVGKDKLDKYYGNLQVGTAASSVAAKNHRIFLAMQDQIISRLRTQFPSVIKGNYSILNNPVSMDVFKHGMVETYLSNEVNMLGPQQGKSSSSRSSEQIFVNLLEEVAWMLANNDEECCEGRDGRFYRKDYESEPQKGFIENTVTIEDGVNLTINDENSQICGDVHINKLNSPYELSKNAMINTVVFEDSKVNSVGTTTLAGNVHLKSSDINGGHYKAQGTRLLWLEDLEVDGNPDITAGDEGIDMYNVTIEGSPTISGDLIMTDTRIEGNGSYAATAESSGIETLRANIHDSYLRGSNNFSGFYYIQKRIQNSTINGSVTRNSSGVIVNTAQLTDLYHDFNNATFTGIGVVDGYIEAGTIINGYAVPPMIHGVLFSVSSGAINNSKMNGTIYMDSNVTLDNATVSGTQVKPGNAVHHITSSIITNSTMSGAPRVVGSTIFESNVSGVPYISGSHLGYSSASCNAVIEGRTLHHESAGCGYPDSRSKKTYDQIINEMDQMVGKGIQILKTSNEGSRLYKQKFQTISKTVQ